MSTLCELPVELLALICSYICPEQSTQAAFASSSSPHLACNKVQASSKDLYNLSKASHHYHAIIVKSLMLYQTISLDGSFHHSIAFLRLITCRPEIGGAVRRLYLDLTDPHDFDSTAPGMRTFSPVPSRIGLNFISHMARMALGGSHPDLWAVKNSRFSGSYTDADRHHSLTEMLLLNMNGLEDWGYASSINYETVPFSIESTRDLSTLPSLKALSLVFARGARVRGLPENFPELRPLQSLYVNSTATTNTTRQSLIDVYFKNMTCITLRGASITALDAKAIIRNCGPLSTFRYIGIGDPSDGMAWFPGDVYPLEIVKLLRKKHAETLRTLCIDINLPQVTRDVDIDEQNSVQTIGSLTSFTNLENLWLGTESIRGFTEPGHATETDLRGAR